MGTLSVHSFDISFSLSVCHTANAGMSLKVFFAFFRRSHTGLTSAPTLITVRRGGALGKFLGSSTDFPSREKNLYIDCNFFVVLGGSLLCSIVSTNLSAGMCRLSFFFSFLLGCSLSDPSVEDARPLLVVDNDIGESDRIGEVDWGVVG